MTQQPTAGDQGSGGKGPHGQVPQGQRHSIWQRPARSGRGPVPEHSLAEIARAAVTLADSGGLSAVTMRAVAAAIGTGAASLYRYVETRDELLELMIDQVVSEDLGDGPYSGDPVADLLALAHRTLGTFRRHPWLVDMPSGTFPGPGTLMYMEQVLAILAGSELSGSAKLELFGLYSGMIMTFARLEVQQQQAGRDIDAWMPQVAAYLIDVMATGKYPHLAAALAGRPADGENTPLESAFDRALARVLAGLLGRSTEP
jgi:AcrR family transcriptional regulator